MADKAAQERATAGTLVVLGVVFTVAGLARDITGLWASGVALAAAGAGWFVGRGSQRR